MPSLARDLAGSALRPCDDIGEQGASQTLPMPRAIESFFLVKSLDGFHSKSYFQQMLKLDVGLKEGEDRAGAVLRDLLVQVPMLDELSAAKGYSYIADKFESLDYLGPVSVRNFVAETNALGDRTPDQWQQDAFGQVDAWLRALGLRP